MLNHIYETFNTAKIELFHACQVVNALLERVELAHFLQWVLVVFEESVILVFCFLCLVLHSLLLLSFLVVGFLIFLHTVCDFFVAGLHELSLFILSDSIVSALYSIFSYFNFGTLFTQIFETRVCFG